MIRYVVLIVIILLILAAVVFFLFHMKEDSGEESGRTNGHGGEDVSDDDIQALRSLLNDLDEEEEPTKGTRTFSQRETRGKENMSESAAEEAGTSSEEMDVTEEKEDEFGEETAAFIWESEEADPAGEEEGEPVVEYRIIIDGRVSTDSIRTKKDEYFIGKSVQADVVLPTNDPVVGKKFLRIKPMKEKELCVLEAVRPDWVLPVWSEESGEWEPHKGKIVFGIEEVIVIALTQFTHRSDKNIARLELAMPGYLSSEEPDEMEQQVSDSSFYEEEDDLFDI